MIADEIHGAIELVGRRGNHVAILLLAGAAHELLADYARKLRRPLRWRLEDHVPKDMAWSEAAYGTIRSTYLSLKHGGASQPDDELSFQPEYALVRLFGATADYLALFAECTPQMAIFINFMLTKHPELRLAKSGDLAITLEQLSELLDEIRPD